jgi:hypothetical protein
MVLVSGSETIQPPSCIMNLSIRSRISRGFLSSNLLGRISGNYHSSGGYGLPFAEAPPGLKSQIPWQIGGPMNIGKIRCQRINMLPAMTTLPVVGSAAMVRSIRRGACDGGRAGVNKFILVTKLL